MLCVKSSCNLKQYLFLANRFVYVSNSLKYGRLFEKKNNYSMICECLCNIDEHSTEHKIAFPRLNI